MNAGRGLWMLLPALALLGCGDDDSGIADPCTGPEVGCSGVCVDTGSVPHA